MGRRLCVDDAALTPAPIAGASRRRAPHPFDNGRYNTARRLCWPEARQRTSHLCMLTHVRSRTSAPARRCRFGRLDTAPVQTANRHPTRLLPLKILSIFTALYL